MSGFGLNASTPRKATEANRPADGRQLCTPSVFASEVSRTAGQDAQSLIEPDRCGLTDVRHSPTATKIPERSEITTPSSIPTSGEPAVARGEQTPI